MLPHLNLLDLTRAFDTIHHHILLDVLSGIALDKSRIADGILFGWGFQRFIMDDVTSREVCAYVKNFAPEIKESTYHTYCDHHLLPLNPTKTQMIVFSGKPYVVKS